MIQCVIQLMCVCVYMSSVCGHSSLRADEETRRTFDRDLQILTSALWMQGSESKGVLEVLWVSERKSGEVR